MIAFDLKIIVILSVHNVVRSMTGLQANKILVLFYI